MTLVYPENFAWGCVSQINYYCTTKIQLYEESNSTIVDRAGPNFRDYPVSPPVVLTDSLNCIPTGPGVREGKGY